MLNDSNENGKPGPARFYNTPAPGQFHSLAVDTDNWEFFVLVLEVQRGGLSPECLVVPGSMDVRKGGPDDLLISHPDYEDCWFLDLSQVRTIRADALLPGFAALTGIELSHIREELSLYRREAESGRYRYGLPYFGKNDSRRKYHADLGALMEAANKEASRRYWLRLASSFRFEATHEDHADNVPDRAADISDRLAAFSREQSFSCPPTLNYQTSPSISTQPDLSFLRNIEKKRPSREDFKLSFTPDRDEAPGCDSGSICLEIRFKEEKIIAEAICKSNPGAFDGIQLRRSIDGYLIGTISGGRIETALVSDLEKGIYFSRPDDTPIKGKWIER